VKVQLENLTLQMYNGGIRYSEGPREFRRVFVLTVLREQKWNQFRASEKLGVQRNTLRRLLRNIQLDIKSLRAPHRRPPEGERLLPPGQETACEVGALCSSMLTDQGQVDNEPVVSPQTRRCL
jgi:hypothetical protein